MGNEQREMLESEEQTRLRVILECKKERRQEGRALATIPEETEEDVGDEESETAEQENQPTHLTDENKIILKQESWGQEDINEKEAIEETEGLTFIDSRNGFNEMS